jgi:hypothetical protein
MFEFLREWLRNKYTAKLENQITVLEKNNKKLTEEGGKNEVRIKSWKRIALGKRLNEDRLLQNYAELMDQNLQLLTLIKKAQDTINGLGV